MLAIFMLMIITMTMFPVMLQLQQERVTIREEREAIYLMQQFLLHQNQGSFFPLPATLQGEIQTYDLLAKIEENHIHYCLQWEGRNGREQSWCLSHYH